MAQLLDRGCKVRMAVRSKDKADTFLKSRQPEQRDKVDLVLIRDLTEPGAFDDAVKDVTGVIHIASVS